MSFYKFSQDNINWTSASISQYWHNMLKKSSASSIISSITDTVLSDYYSKTEVDNLILSISGSEVDLSSYYTADEIEELFENYYTEDELDTITFALERRIQPLEYFIDEYFDADSVNLTINPNGNIILDPLGEYVLPPKDYSVNLGSETKKFLSLHAAELRVDTLVSQDVIATINGRIVVGISNNLIDEIDENDEIIYVKYNNLSAGDTIYFESGGNVEFMRILASVSGTSEWTTESGIEWTTTSGSEWISYFDTDGYGYTVTRDLDGTGANSWTNGQALINTGVSGTGWIDLYAINSMKGDSQEGPTIVGNLRNSSTYNDWSEYWAIGNLNGVYGYGVDTWGAGFGNYSLGTYTTHDSTNGIRMFSGDVKTVHLTMSGSLYLGDTSSGKYININSTDGIRMYANGTVYWSCSASGISSLNLLAGSDITLNGDNDSPARLYLNGTTYGCYISNDYNGGALQILTNTDSDGLVDIKVGFDASQYFRNIWMYLNRDLLISSIGNNSSLMMSYNDRETALIQWYGDGQPFAKLDLLGNGGSPQAVLSARYDSDDYASITVKGLGSSGMEFKTVNDGTSTTIQMYNKYLGPNVDRGTDLGYSSSYEWDQLYIYNINETADFFFLDDRDDLAELAKIKGSGIYDEVTGLELINDDTLPDWALARYSKDIYDIHDKKKLIHGKGDIMKNSEGKPSISSKMWPSWLRGALIQEDNKVEELKKEVKLLKAEIEKLQGVQ